MQYLKVFTDFKEFMEPLNDEEKGRLFVAMLDYAQDGSEPGLEGNERFVWAMAKRIIDREAAAYESKVKHLRRGAAPVSEAQSPGSCAPPRMLTLVIKVKLPGVRMPVYPAYRAPATPAKKAETVKARTL